MSNSENVAKAIQNDDVQKVATALAEGADPNGFSVDGFHYSMLPASKTMLCSSACCCERCGCKCPLQGWKHRSSSYCKSEFPRCSYCS